MVAHSAIVFRAILYSYNMVYRETTHVALVIPVVVSVVLLTIGVVPTLFSVILSLSDIVFLQVVGDE